MELDEIRTKRDALQENIEQLILQFIQETDIEVSEIIYQPLVMAGNQKVQDIEIQVELLI